MHTKTVFLIPVFNDERGLALTLESLLSDPDSSFDIFVYDDGSSPPIVVNLLPHPRVTLFRGPYNIGISRGLNYLLDRAFEANYEFAARIDAGDIHICGRVQMQIEYLRINPVCLLVGGGAKIIGLDGEHRASYHPPTTYAEIHRGFRRGYPVFHPSILIRLAEFNKAGFRYVYNFEAAEDYELFYRMHLQNELYVQNLKNLLVEYVRTPESVGIKRSRKQAIAAWRIRFAKLHWDFDAIAGLFDIGLIVRMLSPRIYRSLIAIRSSERTASRTD